MSLQWFRGFALVSLVCGAALHVGALNSQNVNPERGAQLFQGKGCVGCHQPSENPIDNDFAELSPKTSVEVTSMLMAFREGDKKNEAMNAISAILSDQDIADLAAYLAVN